MPPLSTRFTVRLERRPQGPEPPFNTGREKGGLSLFLPGFKAVLSSFCLLSPCFTRFYAPERDSYPLYSPGIDQKGEKGEVCSFDQEKRGVDKRGGPCAKVLSVAGFSPFLRCFPLRSWFILR